MFLIVLIVLKSILPDNYKLQPYFIGKGSILMKKFRKTIVSAVVLALFSFCVCVKADKIKDSDKPQIRESMKQSIFDLNEVKVRFGVPRNGLILSPMKKEIQKVCSRRIELLRRLRGNLAAAANRRAERMLVGSYLGECKIKEGHMEYQRLNSSKNEDELQHNIDVLISVYESILGEYGGSVSSASTSGSVHRPTHFLDRHEGRNGFSSRHRQ